MTDEHDAPLPDPTPLATGGVIHDLAAIRDAAARIRAFLELPELRGHTLIGTESDFITVADLVTILDALDACTVPASFIEFPKPLSEQEYEELKATFVAAQDQTRRVHVEWIGPPADSDTLIQNVRRWIRTGPGGRATGA